MLFKHRWINWNASKGKLAPIQKFERPSQKIPKSEIFFISVKNWCPHFTWKLYEAISPKIWIETLVLEACTFMAKMSAEAVFDK